MNTRFYKVGGAVRDRLMGLKPKDVDYAVECESFDVMREEILKRGVYKDGRRPESVTVGTIFDDLARRDFTMNAIAISCHTGETIDSHGGVQDIESKVVRCVGNPRDRFNEDRLRVFRAIRFSVTKNFRLDPEMMKAISIHSVNDFENVSTERIREELLKMFSVNSFYSMRLLMDDFPSLGLLVQKRNIWFEPTTKAK